MLISNIKKYLILLIVIFTAAYLYGQDSGTVQVDSIIIKFTQAPTPSSLLVNKAALKYNKDFALSLHVDDGDLSAFTHGYPVFQGGELYGTTYPGLMFTDGCGNNHNFKMSTAIFSFNGNGMYGPDVHNDNAYGQLSWQQLDSLYQNNWGIFNHGINGFAGTDSAFIQYSISRNYSYIRRKLYESTPGGVTPSIFVNPNGVRDFIQPALDLGYNGTLNQKLPSPLGVTGGNVNDVSVDWTQGQNLYRSLADVTNVLDFAEELDNSSINGANFWGSLFTHSVFSSYAFNDFRFDFNTIGNIYGANGKDNILVASEEEILDYLIVRDATDIHYDIIDQGKGIRIYYTGSVPVDLLHYSSSLTIESDAEISEILVYGCEDFTHSGTGDVSTLINLNWNGYVIPDPEYLADSCTEKAINSQLEYDCLIAMDYIITLDNGSHKDSLRQLLCSIPNINYDDGFCLCEINIEPVDTLIQSGTCIELTGSAGNYSYEWYAGGTLIDTTLNIITCPVESNMYTHVATNNFGCPASDSIMVNVFTVDFSLGQDTSICVGECVELQGPPEMDAYVWVESGIFYSNSQNITVCPNDTKEYILHVSRLGLQNSDSIIINVKPAPDVSFGVDTSIIRGDSLILSGPLQPQGELYIYTWNTGHTSREIIAKPDDSAQYILNVSNSFACIGTDSIWVYTYGIPEITANQSFYLTENSINGKVVGTVSATDSDDNTILQDWTIVSGNTGDSFSISESTGTITIADSSLIDFEIHKSFTIGLTVTDGTYRSDTVNIIIDIGNINDMYISDILIGRDYCPDDTTFSISYNVNEYIPPLTFQWTSGELVKNLENRIAGDYTVIISDSTGYSLTKYFSLETIPVYDKAKICYVTSDIDTNYNRIYINKGDHYNVDKFVVYRLMNNNNYVSIGEISKDEDFIIDSLIDNRTSKQSYKVGILDSCGIYSSQSDFHETSHLGGNQFIENTISLSWNTYSGVFYSTYRVYRSINNGNFENIAQLPSTNNSFNDEGVDLVNNLYKYYISIIFSDSCDIIGGNISTKEIRSNILQLGNYYINSNIELESGWNIVSFDLMPEYPNLINVLNPLIQSGNLYKCIDKDRNEMFFNPGIGWVNDIGDISLSKGYLINVKRDTSLLIRGVPVEFPYTIELEEGWNLISYPLHSPRPAMSVLNSLLINNKLYKVINESGDLIQNISGIGWINSIGNFIPGEGYFVNVLEDIDLIITENGSLISSEINMDKQNPGYKTLNPLDIQHLSNNPFMPMNILLKLNSFNDFTPQEGDIFLAVDNNKYLGMIEVSDNDTLINLTARASEGDSIGFSEGNTVRLQYLSIADNNIYNLFPEEIFLGEMKYHELGSLYASYSKVSLSADNRKFNPVLNLYPNPVKQEIFISFNPETLSGNKDLQILIFNLEGKQQVSEFVPAGETSTKIGVNDLAAGVYQIIITSGGRFYSRKFIKL